MSDDLRLQMMGIGGPAAPAAPSAQPAQGGSGAGDAGYPTFQSIIVDKAKADAFLAQAKATQKKLDELAAGKGASAQAKAEARKALRAYDHAMGFVKTFAEQVQKVLAEQQAKAKPKAGAKK
jgi:S-formylglutathione hydrolase FrmB